MPAVNHRSTPLSFAYPARRRIVPVLVLMAVAGAAPGARAQDASFGCKVLLCAAASTPGWATIPYCVPVMQQLFSQLARRGGWPVCQEAQASSLGYEPYLPCPDGLTTTDGASASAETEPSAALCADLARPRQECGANADGGCRTTYPTVARQLRQEPNFVDLTTASGTRRFYFSLKGY